MIKKLGGWSVGLVIMANVAVVNASDLSSDGWSLFTQVQSFSYSEPVSINAALHNLNGDFEPGDTMLTHDSAELGARYRGWSISYVARYDYQLHLHPDTAELIYIAENDLPIELGRVFQLDLSATHSRSRGFKLGYETAADRHFGGGVWLSYLQADKLTEGRVQGQVSTAGNNTYSGQVDLAFQADRDYLLGLDVNQPVGQGYAVDLRLFWNPTSNINIDLRVEDALSRMYWKNTFFTTASATLRAIALDSDGNITKTELGGDRGYRKLNQKFPLRSRLTLMYDTGAMQWGGELFKFGRTLFPRLHAKSGKLTTGQWSLIADFKAEALGIGYENEFIRVLLLTDDVRIKQAHTLQLELGLQYLF